VAAGNRLAELSRHFVDVVPVDVFAWDASNPVPKPQQIEGSAIHVLARGQDESQDLLPRRRSKEARPFLARGDRGYLATLDGRFAGWLWLSRVSHRDPWSGLRFRIAPDEAYVYAMWGEPEFRKLGVAGLLMSAVLSERAARSGDQPRLWLGRFRQPGDAGVDPHGIRVHPDPARAQSTAAAPSRVAGALVRRAEVRPRVPRRPALDPPPGAARRRWAQLDLNQ
jgi:GNAT superfamily N-acetyltransferase